MPSSNHALSWVSLPKTYEAGVEKVALFVKDAELSNGHRPAVAWGGCTAVNISSEGGEVNSFYADNIEYLQFTSKEKVKVTIEAYSYPDEFEQCDGTAALAPGLTISQQRRSPFNLVFMTSVGNEAKGTEYAKKLHFVVNMLAAPSERAYATINEEEEPATLSWECSTKTERFEVDGEVLVAAHYVVDSRKVSKETWDTILEKVYGGTEEPKFLKPSELATLCNATPEQGQ